MVGSIHASAGTGTNVCFSDGGLLLGAATERKGRNSAAKFGDEQQLWIEE